MDHLEEPHNRIIYERKWVAILLNAAFILVAVSLAICALNNYDRDERMLQNTKQACDMFKGK